MKLSELHEATATPLTVAIRSGIGRNYFQANRAKLVPAKPQGQVAPNASYGLGGGNYGAQMSNRHKEYFGGDFGH